jgi:copper transport protein
VNRGYTVDSEPRGPVGRLGKQVLAVAVLVAALLALLTTEASAHAELVDTNPANGAHLDRAPTEVVLRFTENVNVVRGGFTLLDGTGAAIPTPAAETFDDGSRVRLPLPDSLGDGVFVLNWRVVSADSHPVHGAFVFSVGAAQAAPLADAGAQAGSDSLVGTVFWVVRLLGYLSLAVLVGGAFFVVVCWPAGRANPRVGRLLRLAWIGAVTAAVLALALQGPNAAGLSLAHLFDPGLLADTLATGYGVLLLVRVLLLGVTGYLVVRLVGSRKSLSRGQLVLFGTLGLVLVTTWSGTGHQAAAEKLTWAALALDIAHLSAVSIWLGGLVVLAACALGRRSRTEEDEAAAAVTAYSRAAAIAVVVLGASGLLQALREIVVSGVGPAYFSLLAFKVGAFGLLIWLAALSRAAVRRRLLATPERGRGGRRAQQDMLGRLRQSVRWEVVIAGVVLGLTAALVATPPGGHDHGPVAAADAGTGPFLSALAVPGGDVQVWVDPARTGQNQIVLNVRDGRGINRDVPEVRAQLRLPANNIGPLPVTLSRTGAGQFTASNVVVPVAGAWQLSLQVRSSDFDETTVDTQIRMR